MAIINFDKTQRREYKEPQTTKKELLKPPSRSAYSDGWNTPRSASSVADLVTNNGAWSFDALNTTESPSKSSVATKQEAASPMPDNEHQKQPLDLAEKQALADEERRDSHVTNGRGASGTSSDDKYGRTTGVIDLTADDSEPEQEKTFPERQFVPRAEHDGNANQFQRRKSPSPPRTFTRGLSQIAAHPRKAPIVHRSKPPIKPRSYRQSALGSSPAPPASHSVFSRSNRPSANPTNEIRMPDAQTEPSPVRKLECTPLGDTTDTTDQTPVRGQSYNSSVPKKAAGPFIQNDDSSDDGECVPTRKPTSRDSEQRLINRPRNDTPTRSRHDDMVERSRLMRQKARERAGEDHTALEPNTGTIATAKSRSSAKHSFLGRPHQR